MVTEFLPTSVVLLSLIQVYVIAVVLSAERIVRACTYLFVLFCLIIGIVLCFFTLWFGRYLGELPLSTYGATPVFVIGIAFFGLGITVIIPLLLERKVFVFRQLIDREDLRFEARVVSIVGRLITIVSYLFFLSAGLAMTIGTPFVEGNAPKWWPSFMPTLNEVFDYWVLSVITLGALLCSIGKAIKSIFGSPMPDYWSLRFRGCVERYFEFAEKPTKWRRYNFVLVGIACSVLYAVLFGVIANQIQFLFSDVGFFYSDLYASDPANYHYLGSVADWKLLMFYLLVFAISVVPTWYVVIKLSRRSIKAAIISSIVGNVLIVASGGFDAFDRGISFGQFDGWMDVHLFILVVASFPALMPLFARSLRTSGQT